MPVSSEVADAQAEARQARRMAILWWVQLPLVCGTYYFELLSDKVILTYLAAVSIIAIAVTYSSKAKAAEAKAASYQNP